jgi:hypothetical protein
MDLQKLLAEVPKMASVADAFDHTAKLVGGITLTGSLIGQTKDAMIVASADKRIYEVPVSSVVAIRKTKDPVGIHFLDGTDVEVRIKKGTILRETRILEVGVDIVDPELSSSTTACPSPDCTKCPNGRCCCPPKRTCNGTTCF